jgi:hypothetical protein
VAPSHDGHPEEVGPGYAENASDKPIASSSKQLMFEKIPNKSESGKSDNPPSVASSPKKPSSAIGTPIKTEDEQLASAADVPPSESKGDEQSASPADNSPAEPKVTPLHGPPTTTALNAADEVQVASSGNTSPGHENPNHPPIFIPVLPPGTPGTPGSPVFPVSEISVIPSLHGPPTTAAQVVEEANGDPTSGAPLQGPIVSEAQAGAPGDPDDSDDDDGEGDDKKLPSDGPPRSNANGPVDGNHSVRKAYIVDSAVPDDKDAKRSDAIVEKHTADITKLSETQGAQAEKLAVHQTKHEHTSEEIKQVKEDHTKLRDEAQDQGKVVAGLEVHVENQKDELNDVKDDVYRHDGHIKVLVSDAENRSDDIIGLQKKVGDLEANQHRVTATEANLFNTNNLLGEVRTDVKHDTEHLAHIQGQLDGVIAKETEVRGLIQGVSAAQQVHGQQIAALGTANKAYSARVAGVEGAIAGWKDKTGKVGTESTKTVEAPGKGGAPTGVIVGLGVAAVAALAAGAGGLFLWLKNKKKAGGAGGKAEMVKPKDTEDMLDEAATSVDAEGTAQGRAGARRRPARVKNGRIHARGWQHESSLQTRSFF